MSDEWDIIEDPAHEPDEAIFSSTTAPEAAPDRPTRIRIDFKDGLPSRVENLDDGTIERIHGRERELEPIVGYENSSAFLRHICVQAPEHCIDVLDGELVLECFFAIASHGPRPARGVGKMVVKQKKIV